MAAERSLLVRNEPLTEILPQGRQRRLSRKDFTEDFLSGDFRILGLLFVLLSCMFSPVSSSQPACIVKGHLYTQLPWYGYLVQKTFKTEMAKIQYQLSFPVKECCLNLLIYYDDQLRNLKEGMTCREREAILPPQNNQIIPLTVNNKTKGCMIRNDTGEEPIVICVGERTFASSGPRTWYFAVSKCDKSTPTSLWYYFNITGYYGNCEADPLAKTYIPPPPQEDRYLYLAVALGIVAGLAFVVALIFFGLWFMSRRQKETKTNKKDGGNDSVTSSQATMTQDIFYVNPSISDRDTSDYSRSSSENYYEVIPEGRSYDSVDQHHLAVPHNGGPHNVGPHNAGPHNVAHQSAGSHNGGPHASGHHSLGPHVGNQHNGGPHTGGPQTPRHMTMNIVPKEFRQYHHPPMTDDYPPPPYPMHAIGKHVYPSSGHPMAGNSLRHPPHHQHPHPQHQHHHAMETSA